MNHELKKIIQIGIPSTVAIIGQIGYGITDNIMAGKFIGAVALAQAGIATSLFHIFLVFGIGCSSIMTSLIAEVNVHSPKTKLRSTFQNCALFNFVIGIFITLFLVSSANTIIPLVNKQAAITEEAIRFLHIIGFASFFVMIFFSLVRLSEGLANTKYIMYTVLFCNVVNIILNYIFMKQWGVSGLAASTLVNSVLEVVISFLLIKRNPFMKRALNFSRILISGKRLKKIAILSLPAGLLMFFESTAFNVAAFICSRVSVADVSAHQILYWVTPFVLVPVFGFSGALTSRVAHNIGLHKPFTAFKISVWSIILTAIYAVLILSLVNIFGEYLLKFMLKGATEAGENVDKVVMSLIIAILPALIIIETFDALQVMLAAILRGFSDTKVPSMFALFSYWALCIPLGYLFGITWEMGVMGVWFGLGAGLAVQSSLLGWRLFSKHYKKFDLKKIRI